MEKTQFFLISGVLLITLTLSARANNITVGRSTITRVSTSQNNGFVQFDLVQNHTLKNTGRTRFHLTSANHLNNGGFETGDLTAWSVTGSAAHVEVLQTTDFIVSGGTDDFDTSILSRSFTLNPGDVPATLSFDWSFMTSEGTRALDPYDDFFHVRLNGEVILAGSKPGGSSPYPDVATDGASYQVTSVGSNGSTLGSDFVKGRSSFSNFSMVITDPGTYTLEFLVADQEDNDIDSGLLVDNVQLQMAGLTNGSFENGDLTDWIVAGSAARVEVLQTTDFIVSGGTLDYDTSILSRSFTLNPGDVPATLSFDWSFMTSEGTRAPDPYDDFFHVTLNNEVILAGSKPGGSSPYPDVATDGASYQVTSAGSNGSTLNSDFTKGRSSFSNFSMVITEPGTYTLEFLVADQADNNLDSGLLVDNVQLQLAGLTNGGFETGDLTDWSVAGSAARVEVLQAVNFTPNIIPTDANYFALLSTGPGSLNGIPQGNIDSFGRPEPTEGNYFALLSTGPGGVNNSSQGNIDSFGRPAPTEGNYFALLSTGPGIVDMTNTPQGNIDSDPVGTFDYDTSILHKTFTLSASDVPATLNFDWSFLTGHASNTPDVFDDFFQVTLNGIVILSGSRPIGGVSPYPDVVTDGATYLVNSTGTTNNSQFANGRSRFSNFSMVITIPGTYTLEFLVADQADNNLDSGLLVDNVRIPVPEMDVQQPAGTSIADGGNDNVGNQNVGAVNLTYTIDNSVGTATLTIPVGGITASNYVNTSGFSMNTALPLNVAAVGVRPPWTSRSTWTLPVPSAWTWTSPTTTGTKIRMTSLSAALE